MLSTNALQLTTATGFRSCTFLQICEKIGYRSKPKMPTTSQCLILMTDDEIGPKMAMRRYTGVSANVSVSNTGVLKQPATGPLKYSYHAFNSNDTRPSLPTKQDGQRFPCVHDMEVNGFGSGKVAYNQTGDMSKYQKKPGPNFEIRTTTATMRSTPHMPRYANDMDAYNHTYEGRISPPTPWSMSSDETSDSEGAAKQQYGINEKSYGRLEELGFRKRQPKRRTIAVKEIDASDNQLLTGIIKDANYIPTPPGHRSIPVDSLLSGQKVQSIPVDKLLKVQQKEGGGDQYTKQLNVTKKVEETPKPKQMSLLDELKQQVGYDNRIPPAIHMRKTLPESDPTAVCFSIDDPEIAHKEIKEMVQSQTGLKVKSIQYDPVAIRAGSNINNRWIVRFELPLMCKRVVRDGLEYNGRKILVKTLDEIYLFEHTAYLAKCQEEREKAQRSKSRKNYDGKKKSKRGR